MGKVKQIEIINRTYHFYNGIINIEEFDSNLLEIDKKTIQRYLYLLYWIHRK